ncbi:MAG: crosslink repair DNA glycosylase YcaQ family protein, partial [Chloroflexota bacterium]
MTPTQLSLAAARRLALRCQGLDGAWALPTGKQGVNQAIARLGYVQIDTIAVVERAHHHTLWARCPDYDPAAPWELLAERRIFEYAAPVASFLPMSDYRYHVPAMRAYAQRPYVRHWLDENVAVVEHVLGRIRDEGALGSADFEPPPGAQSRGWWDWKPAKRALDHLHNMGVLMVRERRNFQRRYDLAERVLPPETDTRAPDAEEVRRHRLARALAADGVVTLRGHRWGQKATRAALARTAQTLVEDGAATTVAIEGVDDPTLVARPDLLAEADALGGTARAHILSPFDNLIIDRDRLLRLFGFDYAMECYLPAAKRRYGYFMLPILWNERFVARADCKADRQARTLVVRQLMLEPDVPVSDGLVGALAAECAAFARFNGCDRFEFAQSDPAGLA